MKTCLIQIQMLLLGVAIPLLLCFGSVVLCADGKATTRKTIFEAYENTKQTKYGSYKRDEFVYSYHALSLAEVEGTMVAVAEARYKSHKLNYSGEIMTKYSTDQGKTWETIVAIPRKTGKKYARSINPAVVPYRNDLLIFAERFEEWSYDWADYKNGDGDFVRSFSYNLTYVMGKNEKTFLEFQHPTSLLPELSNEMKRLEITRLIGAPGRGIEVNRTAIVPVVFFKNKKERYSTVLLSGLSNCRLAKGTVGPETLESAVVEWEGKLIMNARTDDGYRKVYESADMGDTWKEALGSLSRVWGNAPNRKGIGSFASFITVTIENTPVMLFSHPLNTKGGWNRDRLNLWLTDNKRIYDVGQISEHDESTGHSSLLYTNGNLYCLYAKDRYRTLKYYSSVLAHLVDELKTVKAVVKKWKNQDKAFSESCDGKDSTPSYPGSTCEVHIPQNGLVGFLSNESTATHWKDSYSCVDAEITHGVKVKNGIKFNAKGAGAMWPVGKQGQNQRYHFMNHEFTLAATVIIHESTATNSTSLVSVVLDTTDHKTIIDGGHIITGNSSIKEHELKEGLASLATDKPVRIALTFQNGIVKLYLDGKFIKSQAHMFASGLLSTHISHICILQCGENKLQEYAQVTVQNVLLYNRVLSKEEIDLLYLPIIPTNTPTISKTNSHTNSLSKALSTTETPSQSLSHTTTQSLSHTASESQSLSNTGTLSKSLSHTGTLSKSLSNTGTLSKSLSNTGTLSHSLSHTGTLSKSLSNTGTLSKSLSNTGTLSHSLSHTGTLSKSLSHTYEAIKGGSMDGMKQGSSLKRGKVSLSLTKSKSEDVCVTPDCGEQGVELSGDQDKYSHGQWRPLKSTQNPLHSSDRLCPSIFVETFPAGDLTQKDIDGSNNGKRLLLVSLPKQLYWPINDSVSSLISFSGGSRADHPNGFSGKWGEMLRSATWRRNTTKPRSVLEIEIPTYSNYNIESDEEILISVDEKALSVDCQGPLNGSFTIRAENVSQIVKTSKVINSVIAGMTTATIFCAGGVGSILEIQALSLLSRMNCASKEERYRLNFLPYFTSIFTHFGSLWIVFGNLITVLLFGSIHYGITVVYKLMRGGDSSTAWARMCFPNFTYFVAYIMHIGIFVHSVSLLFIIKAEWHYYLVGIVGTSYGLIFPLFVVYYIKHDIKVQFVPYPHFINQSCFKRWMSPHGYWAPRNRVKMYGNIFFTMKNKYLYWCVFRLSMICIAGIVTVIPTSTENCHMQYFCLMVIFLFGSILIAVANMMRSVFLTSMHTLSFFLLANLCFISGLNHVSPNKLSFNTYFLFTVMLLVVVFITLIYKACLLFYDWMYVTDDAMDSITMKEPFTEGKCKKYDTKRNTLPYGKEDHFLLMQNEKVGKIRNEPYDK